MSDEQPMMMPYEWRKPKDRDLDVLTLVVCSVESDYEGASRIVETLDREQLVSLRVGCAEKSGISRIFGVTGGCRPGSRGRARTATSGGIVSSAVSRGSSPRTGFVPLPTPWSATRRCGGSRLSGRPVGVLCGSIRTCGDPYRITIHNQLEAIHGKEL